MYYFPSLSLHHFFIKIIITKVTLMNNTPIVNIVFNNKMPLYHK